MKKIFLIALIVAVTGCKKWVEVGTSPVLIENEKVFADDQSATSAVIGLHSQVAAGTLLLVNGGMSVYLGLYADEIYNSTSSTNTDQFALNALLAGNSQISTVFWSPAYRNIYQANAIIEGINKSTSLSSQVRDQLLGEVKCIRAYYYFVLVNLFSDVPLVISTDYAINAVMPRTAAADVYAQIIADLKDAKQRMAIAYPSPGRMRPNKWTAAALLSRVYLFMGDWANAEAESTEVINSGMYALSSDLNSVFLSGNNEAIWQEGRDNNNTAEGAAFVPSSSTSKPAYVITSYLLNSFETNDKRKMNWIKANTVSGQQYNYPYKYKVRTSTPVTESVMLVRLAEEYLTRAEARANLNKLDSAKADLNKIRTRANLANTTATTQTDLINAIAKERRAELFCEGGLRWLDMKRTGQADLVLSAIKPNWKSTALLFPIPSTEIDRNPFLTQNLGY